LKAHLLGALALGGELAVAGLLQGGLYTHE
jgi:hypothetical protein